MGGAKNCPETPRQKMISMMYLVLTAMLALNVSAAILNGYAQVDDSLHATIETMTEGNNETYSQFDVALEQNPEKVKVWYDKAQEIKKNSAAFYEYVQNFKDSMVLISEGKDAQKNAKVRDLKKQDDTNVPQRYGINEGNALKLKQAINDYREFMIEITGNSPALDEELRQTFVTPQGVNAEGDSISWEDGVFTEMPMCATLTVLTKLQNDIRHCEGRAVRYLLTCTDATDLRVNKFSAYVIPTSDYVIKGDKYKAQIILAAIDSTNVPIYEVNGQRINSNGLYEMVANTVGQHKIKGLIKYMDQQGEMKSIPFERDFTVGEPSATVSNNELNIMFLGYENEVSVSVPGVSSNALDLKCKDASIKKNGGKWMLKLNDKIKAGGKIKLDVYANIEGKSTLMGSHEYRVKNLPPPSVYFYEPSNDGYYKNGKIAKVKLRNKDNHFVASYGEDGLVEAKFEISSFEVRLPSGTTVAVNGNRFNKKALALIEDLELGTQITIMSIKAKNPDGSNRDITEVINIIL
jgi:gliding motility-associated protein GldM